ncbi:MAG: hypothetical protein JXR26_05210 [Balneolaceae bacterium]|nr:hypothetical protein [Balneolaceae bacterium]
MKYLSYKIYLIIVLVFVSISCQDLGKEELAKGDVIDAEILEESVEDVSIKPVKAEGGDYKLSIQFNPSVKNFTMPDVLVPCGTQNDKLVSISSKGEVLYSGITGSSRIEKLYLDAVGEKPKNIMQGPYADCSVSFTEPGEYDENCGETCSETSLLGGDTWFCVCVTDCRIGWQW